MRRPVVELLATTAVAVLLAGAVLAGPRWLATAAGLPLALVLPGLAVTRAVWGAARAGTRGRLWWGERAVLVPAISLAVLILGGLALYAADVRLTRDSWTLLATGTAVAASLGGYLFRGRRPTAPAATIARERVARRGAGTGRVPGRARRLVLVGLIAVLLGGAGWLSLHTAHAQLDTRVTALSVSQTAASGTTRSITLTLTDTAATTGYVVRVHGADGYSATIQVSAAAAHDWARTLTVPATEQITADLYRTGDTTPYRTVFVGGQS